MTDSHDATDRQTLPDPSIALVVESQRNRELLTEWLASSYDVCTPTPDELGDTTADCVIVDSGAFDRSRSALERLTERAAPVFVPVLLLGGDTDRIGPETWAIVDDVVDTPVEPRALDARLENVFRTRRLSLELHHRTERLEDRFQTLFQSTPDPVLVVDPAGTITAVNDAFADLVGERPRALEGRAVVDLAFEPPLLDRIHGGSDDLETVEDSIVEYEPADGDTRTLEVNVSAIGRDREREHVAVFRDVTERRERKRRLERKTDRLEEFGRVLSHDLRNPLTVARGRLDLARETGSDEDFDAVDDALQRMTDMIEDLLAMAREGQLVDDLEPVSLAAVAADAWETTGSSGDATLSVDVADEFVLRADEDGLRQVLENCFRNAIEHNDGPVAVTVGRDEDGFFVADDGQGIPADEREAVFESGYSTNANGTGFGLSIVGRIAEAHGWTVDIGASASGGATVRFAGVEVCDAAEEQKTQ